MLYKYRLTGTLAAAAMLVAISGCGGAKPAGTGSTGSTGSTTPPLAAVAQPPNQPTTTAPASAPNGGVPAPAAAPAPASSTNAQPATPATGAVTQPATVSQPVSQPTTPATQPTTPAAQPAAPASTPAPPSTAPTKPTPPTPPTPPTTTPPSTTRPQSGSLPFTTIGRGQQSSGAERRAELIQNDASMNAQGVRPQQAVDFNQESVLIVYMGEQNTGGYSVEITSVQLEGSKLVVTVKQNRPSPNAMVTQALTQPYHAVKIPRVPAGTEVSVNWL